MSKTIIVTAKSPVRVTDVSGQRRKFNAGEEITVPCDKEKQFDADPLFRIKRSKTKTPPAKTDGKEK